MILNELETSYIYSNKLTENNIIIIDEFIDDLSKLELLQWNKHLNFCNNCKFKITNNSVKLMIKLYRQFNIKVFPFILKEARKGYSIKSGTYAFSMYTLDNNMLYSYDKVIDILNNKNIIGIYKDEWNNYVIGIK